VLTVLGGHSLMLVITGTMYAGSLINIGKLASIVPDSVRAANLHHAVVAAPTPAQIHGMSINLSGSWQLAHPPADPLLQDDVIYTYLEIPRDALLAAFPDRKLYVGTYDPAMMQVTFQEVTKESLALAAKAAAPPPKPPQPRRRRGRARPAATTTAPATTAPPGASAKSPAASSTALKTPTPSKPTARSASKPAASVAPRPASTTSPAVSAPKPQ
jgi:hypothetical protein